MIRKPGEYRRELVNVVESAAPHAVVVYRIPLELDVDVTIGELSQALAAAGLAYTNPAGTQVVRIVRRRDK